MNLTDKFCPLCNVPLQIINDETYRYDPLVSVEVVEYSCPSCGYEEKVEYLK